MWESAIFVPSYMGLALLSFLFMRVVMKSWGCEKVIGPPGERMTHVINHQDLHFMREFFSSCSCHFSAASSWISHAINEHGNHHKLVYFYHKKYQFLFIVKLLKSKWGKVVQKVSRKVYQDILQTLQKGESVDVSIIML